MTYKILIVDVDNEPNNLDLLDNRLEAAGFEVSMTNSRETALQQIFSLKPALILLSVAMPGMDGFEICRRLKQNPITQHTPIIFLVATTVPIDPVKGFEIGAIDYITTPFQVTELIARINYHLNISHLCQQLEAKNAQLQKYVEQLESLVSLRTATQKAQNVNQMMESAMQATLAAFNCDRAWLLYPCDPKASSWQVPIEVTTPEYPGAHQLNTNIPMKPSIAKVMKKTLATTGPLAFGPKYKHKIPATIAKQFAVQSQLCLVIRPKIGKPWLFGIHQCSYARVWTESELNLFRYFGQNIEVGLGFSISYAKYQNSEQQLFCEEFGKNKSPLTPLCQRGERGDFVTGGRGDFSFLVPERYHSFIGASEPMQTVYRTIDKVATSKASILITGESGTGKELCAEAIHKESQRADKPFVVCNCAAIPEKLIESHLFGHIKGAFTGAENHQEGLVSKANGGTLFLDEIGELPLSMQSTLLRFVQTQTFSKVGSHQLEQVDVRFIWATNRNLLAEIKAKQFREDLYYRLNTIEIKLPALRHRGSDILLLANFFLQKFAQQEQKDFQRFSAEAEQKLLTYEWLGNVRQLKHLVHNLVILNQSKVITAEMVSLRMDENGNSPAPLAENHSPNEITPVVTINQFCAFKEMEKAIFKQAIKHCNGNVTRAAKLLEIGRATLFKKQKQYTNSS